MCESDVAILITPPSLPFNPSPPHTHTHTHTQQSTSPLPQVGFTQGTTQASTNSESLTTPILSLATPNLFSSLPPLFSSFMGDFPFGASASTGGGGAGGGGGGTGGGGGGGGGGGDLPSALVAFPISIQPSGVSGGSSGTGNIILQAQNMGQPFLLTPTYDASRQNPLFASGGSQPFTPPSTLAGISPGPKDLEQLKLQYDRLQQQLIQQQLLLQQGLQHQHQSGATGPQVPPTQPTPPHEDPQSSSQEQSTASSQASRFINTSEVLMSSQSGTATLPVQVTDSDSTTAPKRPRLEASAETT